jgi:choline dehydrogenase
MFGKARIGLEYLFKRSGPMSMAPSQLGAFTRSSPEHEWPNIEYHVQPLSLDAFGEPLHRYDAFTASVCNLNPTSRGRVRITSPRIDDAPSILANYLNTPEDRQVAAESLRRASNFKAMTNWRGSPATSARRSSTRSAPAGWAPTTTRRRSLIRA